MAMKRRRVAFWGSNDAVDISTVPSHIDRVSRRNFLVHPILKEEFYCYFLQMISIWSFLPPLSIAERKIWLT